MPHVTRFDAQGGVLEVREVKDLGWMLRRLGDVRRVTVRSTFSGGGELEVQLAAGEEFTAGFASAGVLAEWLLARRALRGIEVWAGGLLVGFLGPSCRQALLRELGLLDR